MKPEIHAPLRSMPKPTLPKQLPAAFARQALLALAHGLMPAIKKSVPLGNMSGAPEGAGGGLAGRGLWVGVPIPGSGGLPATPFRVVQTRFNCGILMASKGGNVWLAGRVDTTGRVVSAWVMRSTVNAAVTREIQKSVRLWRFAPLRVHGHLTWFHIVLDYWWGPGRIARLHHPLFPGSGETFCRSPLGAAGTIPGMPARFNGVMPHWVLYRLQGHHPLAVALAYGPYPDPLVAQAVALYLNYLVGRLHYTGGKRRS